MGKVYGGVFVVSWPLKERKKDVFLRGERETGDVQEDVAGGCFRGWHRVFVGGRQRRG